MEITVSLNVFSTLIFDAADRFGRKYHGRVDAFFSMALRRKEGESFSRPDPLMYTVAS